MWQDFFFYKSVKSDEKHGWCRTYILSFGRQFVTCICVSWFCRVNTELNGVILMSRSPRWLIPWATGQSAQTRKCTTPGIVQNLDCANSALHNMLHCYFTNCNSHTALTPTPCSCKHTACKQPSPSIGGSEEGLRVDRLAGFTICRMWPTSPLQLILLFLRSLSTYSHS